jgi:hypothetical protein
LLWLTGILAAVILQVVLRHDVPGYFRLLLGLLMLVTPILIGMTAGWLDWWLGNAFWVYALPVVGWVVIAALLAGESFLTVSLRVDDHQRCVSRPSMIVVPSAECQAARSGAGHTTGTDNTQWYVGGIGYQIGSTARGGAVTAPPNQGGGNSGGGGTEDDPDNGNGGNSGGGGGEGNVGGAAGGGGDDG